MELANTNDPPGCPLQLVTLNMEEKKVQVNEDALGRLEKALRSLGTKQVAVLSVMGAFRTGKSFLLDLFLRYLRHDEACRVAGKPMQSSGSGPPRGSDQEFPMPEWLSSAGDHLEGGSDGHEDGFRFKGGMDACTTGIWVWSKPFLRTIGGKEVALLLFDTQGAWDSSMTKEQSATIFGLTAVLSSKQIYNISMQIQEDKVENLAYFMRFAQTAIHSTSVELEKNGQYLDQAEIKRPFQALDFLVRDWRNFRSDWTVEECREQMKEHLDRHCNPENVVENDTCEALHSMFRSIHCFCLPHPGLAIESDTWSGDIHDISNDFIRMVDTYVHDVFNKDINTKQILGSELSTITFGLVLRDFVNAFHDAAPVAMTFTQAMENGTVLLAKEKMMRLYTAKMDKAMAKQPRGLEAQEFQRLDAHVREEVEAEFGHTTIFGSEETRSETWQAITDNIRTLEKRYEEDNARRLEKALVAFANITIIGVALFSLDRLSDYTCDWWSQTCTDLSKIMLLSYLLIFGYIGVHTYLLFRDRGKVAAFVAGGELWKEMVRLLGVYSDLVRRTRPSQLPQILKEIATGHLDRALERVQSRQAREVELTSAGQQAKKVKKSN